MIDKLIRMVNAVMNSEPLMGNNTELMRYFRAEYKNDASNAYEYWISTRNTNYK